MSSGLAAVLGAIDAVNAADPRSEAGTPLELVHAERMTRWVLRLRPDASDALCIAARGQHVGRWTVPRDRYPEGRGGYLRWREDLKTYHADTVAGILTRAGESPTLIERVRSLIHKKNIKTDPEAQTLEDALCLVFLETQLADLKAKTPDDKMRDIVRKTWAKMGDAGRREALALPLPVEHQNFLKECLSSS